MQRDCVWIQTHDQPITKAQPYLVSKLTQIQFVLHVVWHFVL